MAIAVIGAVCISVLLSLVVTPTAYYLMLEPRMPGDENSNDEIRMTNQ
jgi:multidrug efflux pump subunit AcrB